MRLAVELDGERVAPGGTVTGRVRVEEGGESRALRVSLTLYEETRDFTVAAGSSSATLHEGRLATGETHEFGLPVPEDAVASAKTANGELYWLVEAVSDERGLDTRATTRLLVE